MPGVLGEVAEFTVRVEQQVLAPLVGDPVDRNLANLESDDFALDIEQLSSGSQRNERLLRNRILVLLQDGDPGFVASRIERQLWQTTLTAWPKVRTAVAAPQLGQLTERTLTRGRALPSATSPALERAHVLQPQ